MQRRRNEGTRHKEFEDIKSEKWDFKRIFILLLIIFCIAWGVSYYFGGTNILAPFANVLTRQKPVQNSLVNQKTQVKPSLDAQQKLSSLKKEITKLNVSDITKNSPQIKKIQSDLQSIEQLPQTKAKQVCQQICNGF